MKKKIFLFVFLIILAFFLGIFAGTTYLVPTRIVEKPKEIPKTLDWTLQDLAKDGFRIENKSSEEGVWVTSRSFALFIEVARLSRIETIYYSLNERRTAYFWFLYGATNVTFRWDSP